MELKEAAAFYKLGLLNSKELKDLASQWLDDLPYSEILSEVYTNPLFNENVSLSFEDLLQERNISIPSEEDAIRKIIKYYLEMIVSGKCEPYKGMSFIDTKLVKRANNKFPNEEFVGQSLGLERLYTWYRELQDAEDGSRPFYYKNLPKVEAVRKFDEHLREEAKIALETKYKQI